MEARHRQEEINAEDEKEEQHRKNENRRNHEEREIQSEIALNCDWPGCSFHAKNRSHLINHLTRNYSRNYVRKPNCHECYHVAYVGVQI